MSQATHTPARPPEAQLVAALGSPRGAGVLLGDVWWREPSGTGPCPCRMVRMRTAAPRANNPAVVNAT